MHNHTLMSTPRFKTQAEPFITRRQNGAYYVRVPKRNGIPHQSSPAKTLSEARRIRDAFLSARPPQQARKAKNPRWKCLCLLEDGQKIELTYAGQNAGNAAAVAMNRSNVIRVLHTVPV
jgi:hypothetical protein